MKGLILAGGTGSRLFPITRAMSKQLVPVYDKPMIYYPLSVLMLAGIRDILLITSPEARAAYEGLLGDGRQWGLTFEYVIQDSPDGLAQAFLLGRDFIGGESSALILGDNIYYGYGLQRTLREAGQLKKGARIFGYPVANPSDYGVAEFDERGRICGLEEKPTQPKSKIAVTGLYFYDSQVCDLARTLRPSARGELEITDLNRLYLNEGLLDLVELGRGVAWLDTGTPEALLQAAQFVQTVQERQGLIIASPEEIAFRNGWISADDLSAQIERLGKTRYARFLSEMLTQRS
ncbi:MAG: glucose-1-phosphate thymidylyltransferase [Sorangiineae bacterium NIC37A_2]|jgi:glucose-1-phosphate thymidylyltransferase|nr:MAG: glucose-1-phosphate thymidylyltransferase [Sorangiineae bacterium NIC37A_2]